MEILETIKSKTEYFRKTRFALFSTAILKEPLFSMYNLAAFILRKDLGATAFHLAIFTMLRPTLSFLAFFWSTNISKRPDKIKNNFLIAELLSCILFLFFPLVQSIWLVIIASAFHIMFYRAGVPAWMETIKLNIEKDQRSKLYSWSSSLAYVVAALVSLFIGPILKKGDGMYQYLFFGAALLALSNVLILVRVPVNYDKTKIKLHDNTSFFKKIYEPIKESFSLMATKKDFAFFHYGFTIVGFAMMFIQPIIPIFCADVLKLSHTEFAFGMLVFRSIGYAISSPLWGRLLTKMPIIKLSGIMFVNTAIFMICLVCSIYSPVWFYLAYFILGVALAGSHVLWNLSGTIFADKENSALYTRVNLAMVAIRGAVGPTIGSYLAIFLSPIVILFIGSFLCLYSGYKFVRNKYVLLSAIKK